MEVGEREKNGKLEGWKNGKNASTFQSSNLPIFQLF